MTLDELRLQMVAAIKAGDKQKQSVLQELILAVRKEDLPADEVLANALKKSRELLMICTAGREDLRQQLEGRIKILEELAGEESDTEREGQAHDTDME